MRDNKRYFVSVGGSVYRLRSISGDGTYNLRDVDTGLPASHDRATMRDDMVEVAFPVRQGKTEAELDRLDAGQEEMEGDRHIPKGATVWVADYDVLDSGLLCVEGVLKNDIIGNYGYATVNLVAATLLGVASENIFLTEEEAKAAGLVLVETKLIHLEREYQKEVLKYKKLLE